MRTELVTCVLSKLNGFSDDQILTIKQILTDCLSNYDITPRQTAIIPASSFIPPYYSVFIAKKMLSGRAKGTLKIYNYYLMDFFLNKPALLEEMDTTLMLKYLFDLQKRKNLSNNTLNTARIMINTFFEWAYTEGYISKNFVKNVDAIKYSEIPRKPLTDEEVALLRSACITEREKAIIDLLLSSGIRISELIKIRWSDFNFHAKTLNVFGKGSKYRTVLFDSQTKVSLQRYREVRKGNSEYVFVSERSPYQELKKVAVHNIIKKVAKRSKVDTEISAHVLRHTFATQALARGISLEKVKELLGHESCDTTLIYTKIIKAQMQNEYQRAFGN